MDIVTFQPEFRPALPCVFASKDYHEFRTAIVEMDRILMQTGIEERFIAARIASYETPVKPRQFRRRCNTLRLALRHNILLAITANYGKPESYTGDRGFDSAGSRSHLTPTDALSFSWRT